jgi:hypothetical protein
VTAGTAGGEGTGSDVTEFENFFKIFSKSISSNRLRSGEAMSNALRDGEVISRRGKGGMGGTSYKLFCHEWISLPELRLEPLPHPLGLVRSVKKRMGWKPLNMGHRPEGGEVRGGEMSSDINMIDHTRENIEFSTKDCIKRVTRRIEKRQRGDLHMESACSL